MLIDSASLLWLLHYIGGGITHCTGFHYVHRLSCRRGGSEGETRCPRCSRASALFWCPADSHSPSSAPVSPRRSPVQSGRRGFPIVSPVKLHLSCCSVKGTLTRSPAESLGEPPRSASSAACRPRRTYWRGTFAQRPSGLPSGHVVEINDPKNTALLVLLPSACWLRVIFGAQVRALGMKRKPRCRGGEETGECAAELEVMVMVMVMLLVVITMFCSSSAPLSLSHTHSLFLSLFPLSVSLSVRVQNKSCTTHQKPCFNLAREIASLDDIMLTSPLG